MFRTDRHLNKKKNGRHNFYGEEDLSFIEAGTVIKDFKDGDSPPENHSVPSDNENSG